jgi:hypothetical protein
MKVVELVMAMHVVHLLHLMTDDIELWVLLFCGLAVEMSRILYIASAKLVHALILVIVHVQRRNGLTNTSDQ